MGFFRGSKVGTTGSEPTLTVPAAGTAPPRAHWPQPLPNGLLPSFGPHYAPMPGPPPLNPLLPSPPPAGATPPQNGGWRTSVIRRILALTVCGTFATVVGIVGMMVYYTVALPDPLTLRHKERAPVIRILASDGSVLAERGAAHDFMPLDLLPKQVTDAVVATEDRRFYEHWGVDPAGMARAFFANIRAGRFAQGGSTLTQQLAKNLFLTHERTLTRKVEELLLALWLELRLTKSDILELYLNRVYFGGGAYGIEAASQRYFEKSARELTLAESAVIAGLLKAPSKYSPNASPGAARSRGRSVLKKMLAAGSIRAADEKRALAERIKFAEAKPGKEMNGVEYAVDFVLERMPPLVGAGHAEVVVETTIDADLQKQTHAIVTRKLAAQGESLATSQAAIVVLDVDGGIRALVGGRSYAESQYNRVVKARRQPGSAFKTFVFLAALESGLTPDTVAYDLPLTIEGWSPRNTSGRYQGAMPLRKALAESVNTVAARLQFDLGARRVADIARRLGIKSELREDPSLSLGTSEVSLLELTGSYGVLANGGAAIEPHGIRRVRMSSGRVLYARRATRTEQIIAPAHVGAMNDMLNAALVSGTGRRAALTRHPAAGKTGTTTDFRDAVFVGYTAHYAAGVWVGNDNSKPMNKVMGGGLPAEIWREIMVTAHVGKAPLSLPGTARVPLYVPPEEPASPTSALSENPEVLPWLQPSPIPRTAPVAEAHDAPSRDTSQALGEPAPKPQPMPSRISSRGLAPRILNSSRPAAATPSPLPAAVAPLPATPKSAATAYPQHQIGADFISRAVDGMPLEPSPGGVAGLPHGFDLDAIKQRLKASPVTAQSRPDGMMTLGTKPNSRTQN